MPDGGYISVSLAQQGYRLTSHSSSRITLRATGRGAIDTPTAAQHKVHALIDRKERVRVSLATVQLPVNFTLAVI